MPPRVGQISRFAHFECYYMLCCFVVVSEESVQDGILKLFLTPRVKPCVIKSFLTFDSMDRTCLSVSISTKYINSTIIISHIWR